MGGGTRRGFFPEGFEFNQINTIILFNQGHQVKQIAKVEVQHFNKQQHQQQFFIYS